MISILYFDGKTTIHSQHPSEVPLISASEAQHQKIFHDGEPSKSVGVTGHIIKTCPDQQAGGFADISNLTTPVRLRSLPP